LGFLADELVPGLGVQETAASKKMESNTRNVFFEGVLEFMAKLFQFKLTC